MKTSSTLDSVKDSLGEGSRKEALQKFVEAPHRARNKNSWVGIYRVDGKDLKLDAWAGDHATEHTRIPIGQGICGYVPKTGETANVVDVNTDPRYLIHFPSTKSEIVVPIKNYEFGPW